MNIEYVLKTIGRAWKRILLFFLLIVLVSTSFCIGINLLSISKENTKKAKEAFSAIGVIGYSKDSNKYINYAEEEYNSIKNSPHVEWVDKRAIYSGHSDQITTVSDYVRTTYDAKDKEQVVILFQYLKDDQVKVIDYLYGKPDYLDNTIALSKSNNLSANWIENSTYIAYGRFQTDMWDKTVTFEVEDYQLQYYPVKPLIYTDGRLTTPTEEEVLKLFGKDQPDYYRGVELYDERSNYWEDILYSLELSENAIALLTTNSVENIIDFHQKEAFLVEGEVFSEEDYKNGGKKCLITSTLANDNNLKIGDKISIEIYMGGEGSGFGSIALKYQPFFPEYRDNYLGKMEYEIIGIYHEGSYNYDLEHIKNLSDQTILIPETSIQSSIDKGIYTWSEYEYTTVKIKLDSIDELLEEVSQFRYNTLEIYDQGYGQVAGSIEQFTTIAKLLFATSGICSILILLLYVFLEYLKRKDDIKIMYGLGIEKQKVQATLLMSVLLITVIASSIGAFTGYGLTQTVIESIKEASQQGGEVAYAQFYVDGFLQEFQLEYKVSAVSILITIIAFNLVVTLVGTIGSKIMVHRLQGMTLDKKKEKNQKLLLLPIGVVMVLVIILGGITIGIVRHEDKKLSNTYMSEEALSLNSQNDTESGNDAGDNGTGEDYLIGEVDSNIVDDNLMNGTSNSGEEKSTDDETISQTVNSANSLYSSPVQQVNLDLPTTPFVPMDDGEVIFGSYPQTEVTGAELVDAIKNAVYDDNQDAVVDGLKYKKVGERYFRYEPIRWKVLENVGDTMLLMSVDCLNFQQYNAKSGKVTWEDSTIRSWLNGYDSTYNNAGISFTKQGSSFLTTAFTEEEKKCIWPSNVINDYENEYGIHGGSNTLDFVYLLSTEEATNADYGFQIEEFYDKKNTRTSKLSEYALALKESGNIDQSWWLRSPGDQNTISCVGGEGDIGYIETTGTMKSSIRPVLRIAFSPVIYEEKEKDQEEYMVVRNNHLNFGSYPQIAVLGRELTEEIVNAEYDDNGDALVDGVRYRRVDRWAEYGELFKVKWQYSFRYYRYEPIQWRILSKDEDSLLLISEYIIDCMPYHVYADDVTWETSTIRSWLNGYGGEFNSANLDYSHNTNSFKNVAFDESEANLLLSEELKNHDNPINSTPGGNDTIDSIFLLSMWDLRVKEYGFTEGNETEDNSNNIALNTDYSISKGCYPGGSVGYWWLRTPGSQLITAVQVSTSGYTYGVKAGGEIGSNDGLVGPFEGADEDAWDNSEQIGVRPVIRIPLSSVTFPEEE